MIAAPPTTVAEVVVTGARLPPLPGDRVYSVVRPDVGRAGGRRLDDALRAVAGVSLFRRSSSGSANPTIQGLSLRAVAPSGAGRTLVTLDGVPVNDPFGGWIIWSALPPEGVAAAGVIRGAGAGPYGAGALTGVVALTDAKAGDPAAFDAAVGEGGLVRAGLSADSGPLRLTLAGEEGDGFRLVRGSRTGAADTRVWLETRTGALRFDHDFGAGILAARLDAYDETRGSGLGDGQATASGQAFSLAYARPEGDGAWRGQAWIRRSDLSNLSLAVSADRSTVTPANDQYETPALGLGGSLARRWVGRDWTVEIGADARTAEGESRERYRYLAGVFTRDRRAGGRTAVGGAYVEASRSDGDWLWAGGVRVDGWSESDAHRLERDLQTGGTTLDSAADDRSGLVPTARFGVRRAVGEGAWRAAAYTGFRPPTLNELHRPFRVGNDVTEANPGLEPERLHGAEIGAEGAAGRMRWAGTVFANRLVAPVTNVTVGSGPATFPVAGFIPAGGVLRRRINAGRIDAMGFEGEASAAVTDRLDLRAAVALTRARVRGDGGVAQLDGKRPAQAPAVTVTAGLDWRPVEAWRVEAELHYEGERFDDDLNSRRLRPATQVDARLSWRLGMGELYLAAENLLDADVVTAVGGDGVESLSIPRTLRVGFALRR